MKKNFEKKKLIKKTENFSQWYIDVILESGLAEYAPVRGCQIIKPYGFGIWESIQEKLDDRIKQANVKNAYFPLFIPEKLLKKEKKHVEGFSPELAVVTIGGGEKLKEKLIVRPTSETIMYETFSKWIKSWRDLPLKINQWANVVRWEKRPRLFLRTTEFLWQEGHTCHQTQEDAAKEVMRALKMYVDFYREYLAIDGYFGKKSESEKFPGAKDTFTYEMLMPDGKALQGCTSHNLGQNFSKVFKIIFLDKNGKEKFVWQTCWGFTTRSIGAIVMVHGDDHGLIIPPRISPIQVIIVPIFVKDKEKKIENEIIKIKEKFKDLKIEIDLRKELTPGFKFNEWELKGVPLRIEIGEKEIKNRRLTLVRRDNFEKIEVGMKKAKEKIFKILEDIQKELLKKSSKFLKENTRDAGNYSEFQNIIKEKKGFVRAFWCEDSRCEIKIKEETKATTRVLPFETKIERGRCIYCKKLAKRKWLFAQAY